MRILLVAHNFPPEFAGGTELVVLAHGKALRARGHEVAVLAGSERRSSGESVAREEVEGIAVTRILRRPEEDYALDVTRPRVRALFERALAEMRPDVVHVHHWSTLTSDLVRSSIAAGLPALVTLHDLWTTCPRFFRTPLPGLRCPEDGSREPCLSCVGPEAGLGWARLRAQFEARDVAAVEELNAASVILAPSRAHASALARLLPGLRREIRLLPHGLLAPARARSAPRDEPPFRVGSFGNFAAAKGTHLLLEALRTSAAARGVEVRLDGRIVEAGYGDRLRSEAGDLRVIFGGPFGPERASEIASRLDLAVFPSLAHESYGLVVDEAFAAGVPVVVSDRGALPERAGEGGIVVPAGDVSGLRAAIEAFFGDPGLRARPRRGVPRLVRTADDAAADLEALYEDVAPLEAR